MARGLAVIKRPQMFFFGDADLRLIYGPLQICPQVKRYAPQWFWAGPANSRNLRLMPGKDRVEKKSGSPLDLDVCHPRL